MRTAPGGREGESEGQRGRARGRGGERGGSEARSGWDAVRAPLLQHAHESCAEFFSSKFSNFRGNF